MNRPRRPEQLAAAAILVLLGACSSGVQEVSPGRYMLSYYDYDAGSALEGARGWADAECDHLETGTVARIVKKEFIGGSTVGVFGARPTSEAIVEYECVSPGEAAHDAEATSAGQLDLAGQLERLAELHDSGELTDEEYSSAKARLLSRERGSGE